MLSLFTAIARKISPATEVIVLDKRFLSGRSISTTTNEQNVAIFSILNRKTARQFALFEHVPLTYSSCILNTIFMEQCVCKS